MSNGYRGSQWHIPVRESVRTRPMASLTPAPPPGYSADDIQLGDRVYVIPDCQGGGTGGEGTVVPPEGPSWMAERGWVGVLLDDTGDVSNYQKSCLWRRL